MHLQFHFATLVHHLPIHLVTQFPNKMPKQHIPHTICISKIHFFISWWILVLIGSIWSYTCQFNCGSTGKFLIKFKNSYTNSTKSVLVKFIIYYTIVSWKLENWMWRIGRKMSFVDFLLDYASDWIELVKYLPKHLLNHLVITIATHMLAYLMIKMRIIRFTIQTICISEIHLFIFCVSSV